MTRIALQRPSQPGIERPETTVTTTAPSAPPSPITPQRHWWQRPWIGPLALIALAFVSYSLPRYLSLDPSRARVPAPDWFPLHYPILVGHVLFGSVAMITCCMQIWPWLRARHPVLHRRTGRVYVFAGALPAGVCALVDGAVSPFGPATAVADVIFASLWLGSTATGYRMARAHRFAEHRRWMVRSFVMTMSIIVNRFIGTVAALVLAPQLKTTFGGSELALSQTIAAIAALGTILFALLVSQWWLERARQPRWLTGDRGRPADGSPRPRSAAARAPW